MVKKSKAFEPIVVTTQEDLHKNLRKIGRRFNENPDLARLVLVNPILALEDVGVQLSPEVKKHIIDLFRFPAGLKKRKAKLEAELKEELSELKLPHKLPLTPESRADLLFGVLKITPLEVDARSTGGLKSDRTRFYARRHPLVAKLAEYERSRHGALVFQRRKTYDAYRAGKRKHRWLKALRFRV